MTEVTARHARNARTERSILPKDESVGLGKKNAKKRRAETSFVLSWISTNRAEEPAASQYPLSASLAGQHRGRRF